MVTIPEPSRSLDEQVVALRQAAGVRALGHAVLRVIGSERLTWLNGQVTNDLRNLRAGQSRYTAIVHEKGKLLADAWVHVRSDDVLLVVPPGTERSLLDHFDRHIVMEDVQVEPAVALQVVTVQGPRARAVVGSLTAVRNVFDADRLGRGGVDILLDDGDGEVVRRAVEEGTLIAVGEPAWEVARLEAGIPRFGVDFGTDHYVQEAGITARAVSFDKGCYVGQEVVCRLEMRGHVRRQLVSLVLEGEPPAAGTVVGDGLGVITSSAYSSFLGGSVAMAMVKWDVARVGGTLDVAGRSARIVARPVE